MQLRRAAARLFARMVPDTGTETLMTPEEALDTAADAIERELICCDVYARLTDKLTWTEEEKQQYRAHALCYWGEASRQIVLNTKEDLS